MSAKENTKFQVNFKTTAGTLINVYGESVVDAVASMNEMAAAMDLIRTIEANLSGAAAPAATFAAPVPAAAPAAAPSAAPSGHICKHGPMTFREGHGAKGPWKGYFCPAPKGTPDQCSPEFVR